MDAYAAAPSRLAARLRRKNVSKACEACRKRRVKCDGKLPSCSQCLGRTSRCEYTQEEDKRRPASKSYVDLLRRRIRILEGILEANRIDINSAIADFVTHESSLMANSTPLEMGGQGIARGYYDLTEKAPLATMDGTLSRDESLNFDQDGEARYFGPTSGRLEFNKTGSRATKTKLQFDQFCQTIVDGDDVPKKLEDHLINLYFTWEQPWCQVVDENLFKTSRANKGPYFSPLLLNCMLCVGTRYDIQPDSISVNWDKGQLFLDKAEALLHYDLKWPSITTIQSLILLGTVYVSIGADAAGWLHHGMANRLALDMGLNLDSASILETKSYSSAEVELRRQIYWSLFVNDKLSASYTGRICTFLDSQGNVSLPYAPKPLLNGKQRAGFVDSTILELKNWYYDLPVALRLERSNTEQRMPQVYTLHMVYHTSYIILMRPFFSQKQKENAALRASDRPKFGQLSGVSVEWAKSISYKAACELSFVAREYRKAFGSFRQSPITATHCTLSAVLVLLTAENCRWDGTNQATTNQSINICLQVLEELSLSWAPAGYIKKNVVMLRQRLGDPVDSSLAPLSGGDQHDDSSGNYSGGGVPISTGPTPNDDASTRAHMQPDSPGSFQQTGYWQNPEFQSIFDGLQSGNASFLFNSTNLALGTDALPSDYDNFELLNRMNFDNVW
ncbi:fungal-specific transcription factor domain-containing protein [Camillea tinctor]|nr:fungal-specific transcription factor domain-containing protein [Camillea tinctor]